MYDHLPALSIGLVTVAAQAAALAVFVLLRRRVHQSGAVEPR